MSVQVSREPGSDTSVARFTVGPDLFDGDASVVGSFNEWTAGVDVLVPQDDGTRSATVSVHHDGDIHFRYLGQDGYWFDDPDADEVTEHGCVVHPPEPAMATPPAVTSAPPAGTASSGTTAAAATPSPPVDAKPGRRRGSRRASSKV